MAQQTFFVIEEEQVETEEEIDPDEWFWRIWL